MSACLDLIVAPMGYHRITMIAFASPHKPIQDCATRVLTRLLGPCFKTGRIETTTVVMSKCVGTKSHVALIGWVNSQTTDFMPMITFMYSIPSHTLTLKARDFYSTVDTCLLCRAYGWKNTSAIPYIVYPFIIATTPFNCSPHLSVCM